MRNRHLTIFGTPLYHPGALYSPSDQEGLIQMDVDLKLAELYAKGVVITPDIKSQVKQDVQRRKVEYHDKVNQLGVPDKLKKLFLITKKAKAEQYVKELVLTEYDLFLLIHNCSQIRFTHRSKFKPYIPEHLVVSNTDIDEMKTGHPKKVSTKISAGLSQRRYIHAHLFECGSDWHCFYFSHQDIEPADANHWKYGCHVHYISHLWPNLGKRWIWNKFNKRYTEISGSLHIRFEPFEYPHPDEAKESYLNKSELPPWAINFDPNLAYGCGSVPSPVAHMATRGLWVTKVYPTMKKG